MTKKSKQIFGNETYVDKNILLNNMFIAHDFAIAAHRGVSRGDIRENTLAAVKASKVVGADIAEIDIIKSTDGEYFAFHDGFELSRLGNVGSLLEKTAKEISSICYSDYPNTYYGPVERARDILLGSPKIIINIDRSWRYWDNGFLDFLDDLHTENNILLKSPVEDRYLDSLSKHNVKYMYMGIAKNAEDINLCINNEKINIVGVELVGHEKGTPFANPDIYKLLHKNNLFAFVNALDLGNDKFGMNCYDDTMSIIDNPNNGWGKLLELGADIIQTDWPEAMYQYRNLIEKS